MRQAEQLLRDSKVAASKAMIADQTLLFQGSKAERLRWMLLPSEARDMLVNGVQENKGCIAPFSPKIHTLPKIVSDEKSPCTGSLHSRKNLRVVNPNYLKIKVTKKVLSTNGEPITNGVKPVQNSGTTVGAKSNGSHEKVTSKGDAESAKLPGIETAVDTTNGFSCTDGSCVLEENSRPPLSSPAQPIDGSSKKGEGRRGKWHPPPKSIFKPFTEAVEDFDMIR